MPTPSELAAARVRWEVEQARPSQLPPPGDWATWLLLTGRGFGKTRLGSEETVWEAVRQPATRWAAVAATWSDAIEVMFEGDSGICTVADRYQMIHTWNVSKGLLLLKNGSRIKAFTAEKPDRLRGPQHYGVWADERASWRYEATWDNLVLGNRLGTKPKIIVTTTPLPTTAIRDLVNEPDTVTTRGSTMENRANLSAVAIAKWVRRYGGTRLGRQELDGEILDDVEGALWNLKELDESRVKTPPDMERIVVAIDPAVTSGPESDETGIIVAGRSGDHYYILDDKSGRYSPEGWARVAANAYERFEADRVVGEVNNGGDMIESVLRQAAPNVTYKAVRASRGKRTRAEPVAALSEQGRIHMVGSLPELETQLVTWEAGSADSPDRLDAMVWAVTELMNRPVGAKAVLSLGTTQVNRWRTE